MTNTQTLTLACKNGKEMGFLHTPHQGERRGGVLLLMEIFGVNENISNRAKELAEMGYETLAPHLYDFIEKDFHADYSNEQTQHAITLAQQNGPDGGLDGIRAAIEYLKPKGKIFAEGYCYGGSVAWLAACRAPGLSAVSAFYGRLIMEHLDETPLCPIITHFGKTDPSIPLEGVEQLIEAHPNIPTYLYDAGHGFCSDRPQHYNEAATTLARSRTHKLYEDNE